MFEFVWPWMFWLLPLPILSWALIPKAEKKVPALLVPFYSELEGRQINNDSDPWKWVKFCLLSMIWLALVTASSRPLWIGEPVSLPASGRDLLLAVDISGSMKTADMIVKDKQIPRLLVVKAVVGEFVKRRKNDRLGLVLFGSQAYLQVPLTFDRKTVKQLLDEAQLGFAGEKTAIGDAIGLAIKRLRDRPAESRVLILLTDGANTAGEVSPLQAAELAKQTKVKIYTIGVGATEMQTAGVFGTGFGSRTINPSADLDEETLQTIADKTGGQYFRARNPEELAKIYQILDKLEPIEQDQETFRPQKSLFYWPLGIALLITLGLLSVFAGRVIFDQLNSDKEEARDSGTSNGTHL